MLFLDPALSRPRVRHVWFKTIDALKRLNALLDSDGSRLAVQSDFRTSDDIGRFLRKEESSVRWSSARGSNGTSVPQQQQFVLLNWYPSPLTLNDQLVRVGLPDCISLRARNLRAQGDGSEHNQLCHFEVNQLVKIAWAKLGEAAPLIAKLVDNNFLNYTAARQRGEERRFRAMYRDIACFWLRMNRPTWKEWTPGWDVKKELVIGGMFTFYGKWVLSGLEKKTGEPVPGAPTQSRYRRIHCPRVFTHRLGLFRHLRIHDSGIHRTLDNTNTSCTPSVPAILTATTTNDNPQPPRFLLPTPRPQHHLTHQSGLSPVNPSHGGCSPCPFFSSPTRADAVSALDVLNGNPAYFADSEYVVKLQIRNVTCSQDVVLDDFYRFLAERDNSETMVGLIAGLCSDSIEAMVELANIRKVIVISPTVESARFLVHRQFNYFFRTVPSMSTASFILIRLFRLWGWRRIAMFRKDDHFFDRKAFEANDIKIVGDFEVEEAALTYTSAQKVTFPTSSLPPHPLLVHPNDSRLFGSGNCQTTFFFTLLSLSSSLRQNLMTLKQNNGRIVIVEYFASATAIILCAAYHLEMSHKTGYVWFLNPWLSDKWWEAPGILPPQCTGEHLAEMNSYSFTVGHQLHTGALADSRLKISQDSDGVSLNGGQALHVIRFFIPSTVSAPSPQALLDDDVALDCPIESVTSPPL
ncbi:unnamed protein product [Schistocephalus solidus]|uniref:ANF_receptor domain-containing protein n=1 Tax=Schistocephalus solidus TaxID=70667 RepID=A0A183SN34_SCHSO|nr:unnamed protein product [Schistocephalus solidus]